MILGSRKAYRIGLGVGQRDVVADDRAQLVGGFY